MSAFPYLVLLFCLVGLGIDVSASAPSPTPNPECPGMHRIAKSLEKGIKTYTKETTLCKVNNACTGLMCNGTHKQNDFYMKMELKHCKTPPSIHLDLIYKKIKVHKEITQDTPIKLSTQKNSLGISVPVELKLTLKKKRNKITTGLLIQVCATPQFCQTLFTLLPPTTFCLNMKTCPGYNSTGDTPCHVNPTGNPMAVSTMTGTSFPGQLSTTTKHSSSASRPTYSPTNHSESHKTVSTKVVPTKGSSSTLRSSTIKPSQHSSSASRPTTYSPTNHSESYKTVSTKVAPTKGSSSTLRSSTIKPSQHSESYKTVSTKVVPTKGSPSTLRSSTIKPSQHSEPAKPVSTRGPIHTLRSSVKPSTQNSSGTTVLPGDTHAQKRGSGHHHISTGVVVGIVFACLVGVLIIAGAAFYWKKFYRRSRLRAAYYNDISMNEPLYEDFGPEVA